MEAEDDGTLPGKRLLFWQSTRPSRSLMKWCSSTFPAPEHGCGPILPEAGDEVYVSFENIKAFGTVVRVEEHEFGLEFDQPISPEDLNILRIKVKQGAGFSPEEKAAIDGWVLGVDR